jgi:TetR/AcrR family transcriptional regulator
MATQDDLRAIALVEFASAGYVGTSLQRIAEIAGLSKSSVLYHFASKEALLEAALSPAIDAVTEVLSRMGPATQSAAVRHAFIADFVDCMLAYRLEMHIFINQSRALVDIPVIDRANTAIEAIADYLLTHDITIEHKLRFGVALGGAAYTLAVGAAPGEDEIEPTDELRVALITIMTELLDPVSVRPLTPVE